MRRAARASIVTKMMSDTTTPVAPDVRGDYGEKLDKPENTDQSANKAAGLDQGDTEMTSPAENITPNSMPALSIG